MEAFCLRGAGVTYRGRAGRVVALADVDLTIAPGERVALLGPSGAGKSTLLGLLNAMLRATRGTVLIGGRDAALLSGRALRTVRRGIGTIFQQPGLVPSLSALDNVLAGRLPHWSLLATARNWVRPAAAEVARAEAALAAVGLSGMSAARADELSGGQQQRVAIARALVQEPTAVLADEPFSALDPALTGRLAELISTVTRGLTVVMALHDVDLALGWFPRIVGVQGGRVAFDLPASAVKKERLAALYADEVRAAARRQPEADA
jgi:phosphonate transport system ATP-binding protein